MIRDILFDLDGTLIDSSPGILASFARVLAARGLAPVVALDPSIIGPPLADTLRRISGIGDEARGWKADKRQVRCQSCRAISVFDPKRQAQNCEFCGSAQLVPYEEAKPAFRPDA